MTETVRGARCSGVAPVGDVEHRQLLSVQEAEQVQGVFPGGADAVCGDDPGVPGAGHEPGGQGAELAGDLDLAVFEAEGRGGVTAVQLGREADLGPGAQGAAVDALQPAHDGVGGLVGLVDHRADDGVDVVTDQPVGTGAQRGEGTGQGDLPGRRRVHGDSAVGGERTSERRLEGGVACVPAGRDRCRTGAEDGGDDCCRRCCRAHCFSLMAARALGQRAGAVRWPAGRPGRLSPAVRTPSAPPRRRSAGPG